MLITLKGLAPAEQHFGNSSLGAWSPKEVTASRLVAETLVAII